MNPMRLRIVFFACFLSMASGPQGLMAKPQYRFNGKVSRETLESYLARSITMQELYKSPTLDDDIRMLKNTGAKFVGRSLYLWGGDSRIADPSFLAEGRDMAVRIHRNDPDVVLQSALFEIVTEEVGKPSKRFVDHWRRGQSVPDIRQVETKMWFFFLAASYVDVGIEAIHLGQLDLMGAEDQGYREWADFIKHIRGYAAKKARRRYILLDAHVPKGGPVVDGKLLLDFHSFPLRPKEVADSPQKTVLEAGYSDSIYGRSNGGVAPSGWTCDHLPYLVEFDNFGATRDPGQASQARGASIFAWGYDEITWLAHQPEAYRNEWLRYAWGWLKEHDRNGFLEMPGGRMLTNGPVNPESGARLNWYSANTLTPACPNGFSQEGTIKAIWAADSKK